MIEVRDVSKRYGRTLAVRDLSFTVAPGVVTGFLGPNGAGKSTTMRLILGLDAPSSGLATVNGHAYADAAEPMREVGALLDSGSAHPSMSARAHLAWLARAGRIRRQRVQQVLDLVGLHDAADSRVGGFSLGMRQRLGIAGALLGDPTTLILDEPVNGLDPDGVFWIRNLLQQLAAEGRTVFVSSHLMSEMEETADHVVVIGQGQLIADTSIEEFMRRGSASYVKVVSPQADRLSALLSEAGASVHEGDARDDGTLSVNGLDAARIGDIAAEGGIRLHELTPQWASLEAAFMELTSGSVSYRSEGYATGTDQTAPPAGPAGPAGPARTDERKM